MFKDTRLAGIDRRTFLRGLGGAAIALPFFEFFNARNARAQAMTPPKRFLVLKYGESGSTDGDPNKDPSGRPRNMFTPSNYGASFGLTEGIADLANYPLARPYIGIFSSLDMPWVRTGNISDLSKLPPGAPYDADFHDCTSYTLATGRRCTMGDGYTFYNQDNGPSADFAMKLALDPNDKLMHINVTASPNAGPSRNTLTWDGNGNKLAPNTSPRLFFQTMFGNVGNPGAMVDPAQALALQKRKSVLDLIDRDRLNFLNREISQAERSLLTLHLDEIRELEKRANATTLVPITPTCQKPMDPGVDPPSASFASTTESGITIGYSNEDARADVLIDLIAMAFACDIGRYGTFRLLPDQPHINSAFVTGKNIDIHGAGHYQLPTEDMPPIARWGSNKFFKLAEALRKKSEGAGNVLDNSALVFYCEGGSDDGMATTARTHSHGNHVMLVAGKAGGIKTNNTHQALTGVHPVAVQLALMRACGYTGNLGDLTQHATDVFTG